MSEKKILINVDEILDLLIYDKYAYCFMCKKLKISNDLYIWYDKELVILCSACNNKNYFL